MSDDEKFVTILGHVVRWQRFSADLLVRTKTMTGAVDDDDKHVFVIVRDSKHQLPVWSPTIGYVMECERVHSAPPCSLHDREARTQQGPPKSFRAEAMGVAYVYDLVRLVFTHGSFEPLTRVMIADAFEPRYRNQVTKIMPIRGPLAKEPVTSIDDAMFVVRSLDSLYDDERHRLFRLLFDAFVPHTVVAAVIDQLSTRAALMALPTIQLNALAMAWLQQCRTIEERRALARMIDCVVDTPDAPMPRAHPPYMITTIKEPIEQALAAMRRNRSTTLSLTEPLAADSPYRKWLVELPMHENAFVFAPQRDDWLERRVVWSVRERVTRLTLLTRMGQWPESSVGVIQRLATIVGTAAWRTDVLIVAMTAATRVAAYFGRECASLDDVVAGRAARRRPPVVLIVDAHRWGNDSFVRALDALDVVRPLHLIMIGAPYDSNGSPRAGDRGMVFRDLAAATRRNKIACATIMPLVEMEPIGPLGMGITATAHTYALKRDEPTLSKYIDNDVMAIVDETTANSSTRCVHSAPILVAGKASNMWTLFGANYARHRVNEWLVFERSGQLARVRERRHLLVPPNANEDLFRQSIVVDTLAIDDPLGLVVIDDEMINTVDHRVCCRTTAANHVLLAVHADEVRAADVIGARDLLRIVGGQFGRPLLAEADLYVFDYAGVEDVLSASALVADRLYVHSNKAIDELVRVHGSRPMTNLVPKFDAPAIEQPPSTFVAPSAYDDEAAKSMACDAYMYVFLGMADGTTTTTTTAGDLNRRARAYLQPMPKNETPTLATISVDDVSAFTRDQLAEAVKHMTEALHGDADSLDIGDDRLKRVALHMVCVSVKGSPNEDAFFECARRTMSAKWLKTVYEHLEQVRALPPIPDDDEPTLLQYLYSVRERFHSSSVSK